MTFDRKYKKDAFYAYKAWMSDEPFVHICGKRYVERVEVVTRITVYSNMPAVELFANGTSLGRQESPDHFFYFDVPNAGETTLVAMAGACRGESHLRKVETFNENYRLKEQGAVLNWFDVTAPEGCYSLNDKLGDIQKCDEAKAVLVDVLKQMPQTGNGFSPNAQMMDMVNGFTVIRFLNMVSPMLSTPLTKEQMLEVNARLNSIKKPS